MTFDNHVHCFNEKPDRETISEKYYDCQIDGCRHTERIPK
jgi:hypothetical protein